MPSNMLMPTSAPHREKNLDVGVRHTIAVVLLAKGKTADQATAIATAQEEGALERVRNRVADLIAGGTFAEIAYDTAFDELALWADELP